MTDARHLDRMETEGLTPCVATSPPPACLHWNATRCEDMQRVVCPECGGVWTFLEVAFIRACRGRPWGER